MVSAQCCFWEITLFQVRFSQLLYQYSLKNDDYFNSRILGFLNKSVDD